MIFSRMINDPRSSTQPNRLGLTVGLTLYTPRFWDCSKYDFKTSHYDEIMAPNEETLQERRRMTLYHARCRWPHRHMSYKGYLYWTGPKRRYQLNYMGNSSPNDSIFSVGEHHRYTRWFGKGPGNSQLTSSRYRKRFMK